MRIVAALGGNALLRRGEPLDAEHQRAHVADACRALAAIAPENELVVTHGNGPQIGLLALQAMTSAATSPYPLDVLGAETEGMIGYLIAQELGNSLGARPVVTLLTQVLVDRDDPGFASPTKPIGPTYTLAEARRVAGEYGWTIAPDGDRWRRVVPSPTPHVVLELTTIRMLASAGIVVIAAGGGGVPVVEVDGVRHGVEAVVDKDRTAALLARDLNADALLLLTDVDAIYADFGTPAARPLRRLSPAALKAMSLPPGSMGPKAEAAAWFVEQTGRTAVIGALEMARLLPAGEAGTVVEP